jgi:23S rRNA-/tRNA-specific pseudouridylate synthase
MKKRFLDDILLLENEDILVINKSSGISTLDDRKDTTNVLSEVKELL